MARINSCCACQPRAGLAIFKKISQREWQVPPVCFQTIADSRENVFFRNLCAEPGRQSAQKSELAFADNAFGLFRDHAQVAIDFAVISSQWAI